MTQTESLSALCWGRASQPPGAHLGADWPGRELRQHVDWAVEQLNVIEPAYIPVNVDWAGTVCAIISQYEMLLKCVKQAVYASSPGVIYHKTILKQQLLNIMRPVSG